jgi:hypothetical protein
MTQTGQTTTYIAHAGGGMGGGLLGPAARNRGTDFKGAEDHQMHFRPRARPAAAAADPVDCHTRVVSVIAGPDGPITSHYED